MWGFVSFSPQTVKVQGNDISHKLQISRVSKNDEGLYECRVTDANYGELKEYKAQAYLKVNATIRPRNRAIKKSSPLHLTDKKPRKSSSAPGQDSMSSDQRSQSTSTSQTSHSKTVEHSTGSGERLSQDLLPGLMFTLRRKKRFGGDPYRILGLLTQFLYKEKRLHNTKVPFK